MNEFDTAFYRLVGQKLRALRSSGGLTLEFAARRLGTTPKTVQRYEKGERKITETTLKALVEILGGDYEGFLEAVHAGDPGIFRPLPAGAYPVDPARGCRIPILGQIAAGTPMLAEENIEGYTITDLNGGAQYFALRVHGDSMNAIGIQDGYLLIVRQQEEVENGEVAVVRVNDECATVKRFYQTDSTVTLVPQSTNPAHRPQVYDMHRTHIEVLGKVVKVEFTL